MISLLLGTVMLPKLRLDRVLLVRVGIPSLKKEWKLFLMRQDLEVLFVGFLCVAPLQLGGIRGKMSTPSIGWEVLVRSHQSTHGSCKEHIGRPLETRNDTLSSFVW